MGGILRWLDGLQRAHRSSAFAFAVIKKFGDDQAGNLAALISYYAFFSVFPLLLALSTILGFALHGHPSWQQSVDGSVLKQLPVIGNNAQLPRHGSVVALVLGTVLALYSGLGVAKTAQTAFDTVYLVAHTDRAGFPTSYLRAIKLVVVGGLGLIITTLISTAASSAGSLGINLGIGSEILGVVLAVALNAALLTFLWHWLTVRPVGYRDVLPGALTAAVLFEVLQLAASAIITHKLKGAATTYGTLGSVVVMLSWFYLQAQVLLLCAEVNVVRQFRLWPRALTDAPSTSADFKAFDAYADRERRVAHEEVDTTYDADRDKQKQ